MGIHPNWLGVAFWFAFGLFGFQVLRRFMRKE